MRQVDDLAEPDLGCVGELGDSIAAVLVITVVVLVAVFLVIPLLVAVIDLAIVFLLAGADDGTTYTWRVKGWRASGTRQTEIAAARGGRRPAG